MLPDDLFVQASGSFYRKELLQIPQSDLKPLADQRRIFNRSGNIHGKGNQGKSVITKQRLLPKRTAFPGIQHFWQGNDHGNQLLRYLEIVYNTSYHL